MRLLKLSDQEYILINDIKTKYFSSIEKLAVFAKAIELPLGELEAALIEMIKRDHNFAEFGMIRKAFMFSGKL